MLALILVVQMLLAVCEPNADCQLEVLRITAETAHDRSSALLCTSLASTMELGRPSCLLAAASSLKR